MKVRARVKAFEHLPDWAKCCQAPEVYGCTEFTVDLDRQRKTKGPCDYCKIMSPLRTDVWALDEGDGTYGWVPIEILDLDEGPIGVQNGN